MKRCSLCLAVVGVLLVVPLSAQAARSPAMSEVVTTAVQECKSSAPVQLPLIFPILLCGKPM